MDLSNRDQVLALVSKERAIVDKAFDALSKALNENPMWYIKGTIIKDSTNSNLMLWGSTISTTFGEEKPALLIGNIWVNFKNQPASNHPGWQEEGNIRVINPNPKEVNFKDQTFEDGPYWYLRNEAGVNALGVKVPVKVYGPAPTVIAAKIQETAKKQNEYTKMGINLVNSLINRGNKFESDGLLEDASASYTLAFDVIAKYEYEVKDFAKSGRDLMSSVIKVAGKYQAGNDPLKIENTTSFAVKIAKYFFNYRDEIVEPSKEYITLIATQADKLEAAGEVEKANLQYAKIIEIIDCLKPDPQGLLPQGQALAQKFVEQGNKYMTEGNLSAAAGKYQLAAKDIAGFNDNLGKFADFSLKNIRELKSQAIKFADAGKLPDSLTVYQMLSEIFTAFQPFTLETPGNEGQGNQLAREIYLEEIFCTRSLSDLYLKTGDNSKGMDLLVKLLANAEKTFIPDDTSSHAWSDKTEAGLITITGYPEKQAKNNNFFHLGLLHLDAKQRYQAYLNFKNAVQIAKIKEIPKLGLESDNAFAHYLLGITYYFHGSEQDETMFYELKRAIELDPNNPEYYNTLGYLYMEEKAYEPAMENFKKAIEVSPEYKRAYVNMVMCIRMSGGPRSEIKKYSRGSGVGGVDWGTGSTYRRQETSALGAYLKTLDEQSEAK